MPEKDKAAFQCAGDIMDNIRAMDNKNAATSISRDFGVRIEKILQFIKRFATTVGACVQFSPEISSLVVGGMNCVLTVGPPR